MQDALDERKDLDEQFEITGRNPKGILIERPISTSPNTHPVNGNYTIPDEDEDEVEEDLILGDEEDLGDEEEYDVELEEDLDEADIDEDDLVIETDEEEVDEDEDL